jgi:hypothetical protein
MDMKLAETGRDLYTNPAEELDTTSAVGLETRATITTSDSTLDFTMMILSRPTGTGRSNLTCT